MIAFSLLFLVADIFLQLIVVELVLVMVLELLHQLQTLRQSTMVNKIQNR